MRVIGVGNVYRRDDGAGRVVARALAGRLPTRVTVLEALGDGVTLLELWAGADTVVLIDAVASGDAPGTIHRLDARTQPVPMSWLCGSTHAFGVAEAIELGRLLHRLPRRVVVYGIEGRAFGDGEALSPAVAQAARIVAARIQQELTGDA